MQHRDFDLHLCGLILTHYYFILQSIPSTSTQTIAEKFIKLYVFILIIAIAIVIII